MAAIVLAIKYNDDIYFENEFYSKVGGLKCHELNLLELDMVDLIDYDLHVTPENFELYLRALAQPMQLMQPRKLMEDVETEKEKEKEKEGKKAIVAVGSQASMKTVPSSNDLGHEEAH